MSSEFIPENLAQFIVERFDSVAQLEALLLLRASPQEHWTIPLLAKRLYINDGQAAELIAQLSSQGLVGTDGNESPQYCYRPDTALAREMVDRLADTYATHLVPVTNLIHSKPKTRVQEFADAFKLRKESK